MGVLKDFVQLKRTPFVCRYTNAAMPFNGCPYFCPYVHLSSLCLQNSKPT